MPRHDRDLCPGPLESEICSRILDVIESLITQEKYFKNKLSPILNIDDYTPFKRNDFPKPNYKALEAGFPGLRVEDSGLYYIHPNKYESFFFGEIRFEEPKLIYLVRKRSCSLDGKVFESREIFDLQEILFTLYEITEEQLRNIERILFLFET